ncbi:MULTISPECIES: hypothetical protein [Planktothricoides]|uniref:Uncharacterized protein n=1 Tax=Planktothricoides raciborskii FACHB-1370 TaxID=2949576 RepID=A0ABR8EAP9_9CYAN|nr:MULTISPECIES: hypothetical protein [Planktothricoides]MBD2542672.1 hypothetical protein [Planktothricoides raciborskii FACHB-1370]MBD2581130.1 hypothetical protein [Planktothricoides raciborskii FACHB-1261]
MDSVPDTNMTNDSGIVFWSACLFVFQIFYIYKAFSDGNNTHSFMTDFCAIAI